MRRLLLVIFSLISMVGCGASLTAAGKMVKVMKSDPPEACVEVGSVDGRAIGPNHIERCKNDMRNNAAEKGANYVRLETLDTANGSASGTAYKCPSGK